MEKKKEPKEMKIGFVSSDWKDFEGFVDELKEELAKLGLHVYDDPVHVGSDDVGIMISDTKLSDLAVEEISEEHWMG
jgi:hypothetical protein